MTVGLESTSPSAGTAGKMLSGRPRARAQGVGGGGGVRGRGPRGEGRTADLSLAVERLDLLVHLRVELRREVLAERQDQEALGDPLPHLEVVEQLRRQLRRGRAGACDIDVGNRGRRRRSRRRTNVAEDAGQDAVLAADVHPGLCASTVPAPVDRIDATSHVDLSISQVRPGREERWSQSR